MPISLVPQQHLQRLHTQVPYTQLQQRQQFHQQGQHFQSVGARQPNLQQNEQKFTTSNCKAKATSAAIPPELQELAQQFGIKDASKLPSLEDAMGLLGTTSRAETIQTIKELASTPDGMNLIRQFLASDEGAAASEDPNANSQCDDTSTTQQFVPQQPNNVNVPHRQTSLPNTNFHQGFSIPIPHQEYGVPNPYPPKQHDVYGLPNAHQAVSFQSQGIYQPQTNIMSLIKNEAVPHQEYGVPNELATANSEHQGYNTRKQNIEESQHGHEIYGLPNIKPAAPFRQAYYAPRSNQIQESANSEGVPHQEYNVPQEESNSSHETQEPHQEYGVPSSEESNGSQQHETYGLPNIQEPVNFLQQGPYPPKTDSVEPHQEYGVPSSEESNGSQQHETYGLPNIQEPVNFLQQGPYPPKTDSVEPHQEYGVPSSEESNGSQQHETYGLPNIQEPVNFLQQGPYPPKTDSVEPHQEYGVPNIEESNASEQHETYGLPNVQEPVNFLQQGPYPPKTDTVESAKVEKAIVPHQEYNVPNEENHQTQVPHEVYGIPYDSQRSVQSQTAYSTPVNENLQQDQQVPHHEYAVPSILDSHAPNTVQSHDHQHTYALPHQRFFESPNDNAQPQLHQSTEYGAPKRFQSNNQRTSIPILRQISGTLDRTHTNLELGQLLTTTLRPEAGFLERVGAWTRYFAPPGPTIPIVPPQVTEDVNETVDHSSGNAYTIPIPKIPELNEPDLNGLPKTPQLPNVYIPRKFILPPTLNQGPFVRVQYPLTGSSSLSELNEYGSPHQQPQPFDGQTVEEFVPDVSQLPLDQRNLGSDLRTSYGIRTHPHSYAGDSSPAASEQHVAVVSPNQSSKFLPNIDNEEIIENDVIDEEPQKKYGPQRISSYDFYATGKLNRANDDAIIQLIPTQKPYTNQARRIGQVEDASIIDAIATMTSGFRPII